jgi:hypothetical protein
VSGGTGAKVGGIAGVIRYGRAIGYCTASGPVAGGDDSSVGGILGEADAGGVDRCIATGAVSGGDRAAVGGVAGRGTGQISITSSRAHGPATGGAQSLAGGLFGVGAARIEKSYATGSVAGGTDSILGGLAGSLDGGTLEESFATGSVGVDGVGTAGGLLGLLRGDDTVVRESFSLGRVEGADGSILGGLLARREGGAMIRNYWDIEKSGLTQSVGGGGAIGATTVAMTFPFAPDAYLGWDFDAVWDGGDATHLNNGYPFHRWQTVRVSATYAAATGGTITGANTQVRVPGATTAPVTAVPDPGLRFVSWSDGRGDNPRMDSNVLADFSVTAAFGPPTSQWILH